MKEQGKNPQDQINEEEIAKNGKNKNKQTKKKTQKSQAETEV